ncbi:MFS transporter [Candidatus Enterococcus courvalinii]|uniref:MFS transporter n=1 Tax=Candidatus Enterococcus courvalinii TaxID=2815329 RepID=A0ABS3HWF5_9ENTE|nr:MFS transporter [Enterococcus sp. MSG2901]
MFIIKKEQTTLLIIVVFFWFAQYVYIPFQTPFLASMNVATSFIGIIVGAYGISQMVLRIPVGVIADLRPNHKRLIEIGTLLAGVASLFRFFLPNAIGFLIGNVLSGFASATWISFMVYFMSLHDGFNQGSATAKIIMANNMGILLGFLTSSLFYNHLGMRYICLLSIIAGLIGFAISTRLENSQPVSEQHTVGELLRVGLNGKLLLFACLALIQQGIQMAATMSFTNQVIASMGASGLEVGLSSIIYMLSAVTFSKLASMSNFNQKKTAATVILSFALLAAYCFFIPLAPSILLIFLLQVIPGVGTGILFSLLTSEAMASIPDSKKSSAMGIFQAIYAIGMTLLPILVGILSNSYNMKISFWVMSLLAITGVIVSIVYYLMSTNKK